MFLTLLDITCLTYFYRKHFIFSPFAIQKVSQSEMISEMLASVFFSLKKYRCTVVCKVLIVHKMRSVSEKVTTRSLCHLHTCNICTRHWGDSQVLLRPHYLPTQGLGLWGITYTEALVWVSIKKTPPPPETRKGEAASTTTTKQGWASTTQPRSLP